jgi:hypothetical protein
MALQCARIARAEGSRRAATVIHEWVSRGPDAQTRLPRRVDFAAERGVLIMSGEKSHVARCSIRNAWLHARSSHLLCLKNSAGAPRHAGWRHDAELTIGVDALSSPRTPKPPPQQCAWSRRCRFVDRWGTFGVRIRGVVGLAQTGQVNPGAVGELARQLRFRGSVWQRQCATTHLMACSGAFLRFP